MRLELPKSGAWPAEQSQETSAHIPARAHARDVNVIGGDAILAPMLIV